MISESPSDIVGIRKHAARRGLEAWELAVKLRSKYGIQAVEVEWDYADGLQLAMKQVEKAKEAEAAKRAAAFARDRAADNQPE